jgi:signal transduction histidine kinase/ActR/RegA family two-component response regulator
VSGRRSADSRLRRLRDRAATLPAKALGLGVAATLAFLTLVSWNSWSVYETYGEVYTHQLRLQRLIGTIVHLDEVLTTSARMAAATGDVLWEVRYRSHEPRLAAAVEEAVRLGGESFSGAAQAIETRNRALLALRDRAFELVRSERRDEAGEILASEAYRREQQLYAEAIERLTGRVSEHIRSAFERSERQVVAAGALVAVSAGLLLLSWVLVIRRYLADRERAEQERGALEAQVQYVQKLESLGVLAGGIAHDFNNLLATILGNANLAMQDLPEGSTVRRRIERLDAAARHAASLTSQLLAYSGQRPLSVRPLDLSELVKGMADLLAVSISKKATLRCELAEGLPAIEGDAGQLTQVVLNLITNAAEALEGRPGEIRLHTGLIEAESDSGGRTLLGTERGEGRRVVLTVSDTGSGMDAATRARIFDPFFTTKFTGRGLGLAAVLGIVRGHQGDIQVESEPGRGTRVRVLFPCAPLEPAREAAPPAAGWRGRGTVLVVDDEADVREIAEEMLRRLGFEPLAARDGHEALELFAARSHEVAAVLLDMTMPEMSGEESFAALRRLRPDLPVVLMSGFSQEYTVSRIAERQGVAFLEKPFDSEELCEAMREVLNSKELVPSASG